MTRYEVTGRVLSADVEDQSVLLNTESGQYHLLNASGRAMLAALREGRTPEEIAADVAARTGAPAEDVRADVAAFVSGLADRGLIEPR